MKITPLHDRVIVKRIEEGEQIRGGIIIPDSAKEKPQEGEVIAAGEGKYKEALEYAGAALTQVPDNANKLNVEAAIEKLKAGKDIN